MSCKKPARQTKSALCSRQRSKSLRLNSSRVAKSVRSITAVGMPAFSARTKPKASALFEATKTTCAGRRPSAARSMRFWSVVPLPLRKTARRMVAMASFRYGYDPVRVSRTEFLPGAVNEKIQIFQDNGPDQGIGAIGFDTRVEGPFAALQL